MYREDEYCESFKGHRVLRFYQAREQLSWKGEGEDSGKAVGRLRIFFILIVFAVSSLAKLTLSRESYNGKSGCVADLLLLRITI